MEVRFARHVARGYLTLGFASPLIRAFGASESEKTSGTRVSKHWQSGGGGGGGGGGDNRFLSHLAEMLRNWITSIKRDDQIRCEYSMENRKVLHVC